MGNLSKASNDGCGTVDQQCRWIIIIYNNTIIPVSFGIYMTNTVLSHMTLTVYDYVNIILYPDMSGSFKGRDY